MRQKKQLQQKTRTEFQEKFRSLIMKATVLKCRLTKYY